MLMPTLFHNDLFDDFFDFPRRSDDVFETNSLMKTDIRENGNNYELDIDLPGFKKEDIKANLKDGYLTVTATRKSDNEEKGKYLRRERFFGQMSRSYYVGESLTETDIKASFNNGILRLAFPKEETKKIESPKFIAIE